MPHPTCQICRFHARENDWSDHGTCNMITAAAGKRTESTLARILPTSASYLETHLDFTCKHWEKKNGQ